MTFVRRPAFLIFMLLAGACGRIGYTLVDPNDGLGESGGAGGNPLATVASGMGGNEVVTSSTSGAGSNSGGASSGSSSSGSTGPAGALGIGGAANGTNTGGAGNGGSSAGVGATGGGASGGSVGSGVGGMSGGTGASGAGGTAGGTGSGGSADAGVAGCTSASFNGHAYLLCKTPRTNSDAAMECATQGMTLARIDDAAENQWIVNTLLGTPLPRNSNVYWIWVGGSDAATEGSWLWPDGTLFYKNGPVGGLYTNWSASEPNGSSTINCMVDRVDFFWADEACSLTHDYACEQ
jgi:hypothetical protein